MQRYGGEELGSSPHIVVLGSCKVGNFVVSTPVLRGLRNRFPDAVIGFIGSEVTADFERAFWGIDWRCSWDDSSIGSGLRLQEMLTSKRRLHGQVMLALNLDGFNPVTCTLVPWLEPVYVAGGSLSLDRRRKLPWGTYLRQQFMADADWDSPEFLERYKQIFSSNYIAEIFVHLAWVHEYVNPSHIELPIAEPTFCVPDILIHCTTARAAKVWPFSHWRKVVDACGDRGWSIGLVGSPPAAQKEVYNSSGDEEGLLDATNLIDLRGQTSLIELAGACRKARAVVSVDAGPLHIAAAAGVPTYAITGNDSEGIGSSPVRLWMPRCENVTRSISPFTCLECSNNRFRNDDCLVEDHPCMASISPEAVIAWLDSVLDES